MKYINYRRILYKYKYRIIILFAALFVFAVNIIIGILVEPALHISAETEVCNICTMRINQSINDVIAKEEYATSSFVTVRQTNTGDVASVETNTVLLNKLVSDIILNISEKNEKINIQTIKIPMGQIFNNAYFSGKGPDISVKAYETSGISTQITSDFIPVGINQSIYRITLHISEKIELSFPFSAYSYNLETDYIISETAISGRVPESYTNIETSG